jgi:hypothetical protein
VQNSRQITFIEEKQYPLWDEFVLNSPQGSFFYTIAWATVLQNTFERPFKIAVCHKKEHWLGGTLYFINKKIGIPLITPLPLNYYNTPVFYKPEDEKYQKTLAHNAEISIDFINFFTKNYPIWILTSPPATDDTRAYQWQNCIVTPTYSYVLELNNGDDPSKKYSQSVRRKLNQAKKFEPKVDESIDAGPFIDLYSQSYLRHRIQPLISEEQLAILISNLLKIPENKLFYLNLNNRIVAGRIICKAKNRLYDILAGSIDETGLGSVVLMDYLIRRYRSSCASFDFMGAGHPQVEQFKRGFGPKLVHGFNITGPMKFPYFLLYKYQLSALRGRRRL